MSRYSPEQLCFCDESAVNENSTQRRWGWGIRGRNVEVIVDYNRKQRHSLLPLLGITGYLVVDVIQDSYNEERFTDWIIGKALPAMNPFPLPNSVLVMDNAPIHNEDEIRALCTERGVVLEMLPPYSPDYNPIENSFGLLKRYLHARHESTLSVDLHEAIHNAALCSLTPEVVEALYRGCGYFYATDADRSRAQANWRALEQL